MSFYIDLVSAHPLLMAMAQFMVLGTLGEMVSKWVVAKRLFMPFSAPLVLYKMAEWALLAVCIKYAFMGFTGFVDSLVSHGYLPELNRFTRALAISVTMNLQFGLFLVIFHRILDNLAAEEPGWQNIDKGLFSLIWFWIPAHTVTFMLPRPYQIGLAALWSVALGLILGFYAKGASPAKEVPAEGKEGDSLHYSSKLAKTR